MQLRDTIKGLLGVIIMLALAATTVQAQDNEPTEEKATEASEAILDNVTIIGRQSDIADIPGSAHVIDQEELATFMQSDVMRVLRTVPGVYVQEEEGFGLRPNIGIRGSGLDRSSRIALLEDGILIAPRTCDLDCPTQVICAITLTSGSSLAFTAMSWVKPRVDPPAP